MVLILVNGYKFTILLVIITNKLQILCVLIDTLAQNLANAYLFLVALPTLWRILKQHRY